MKTIIVNEHNLPLIQRNSEPAVLALGFFDGVHKGHQQVILTAKEQAEKQHLKLAVMSFFPHPKTVFSNTEMNYLMPMERKALHFEQLGVDILYLVDFTKTFATLKPKQFIQQYVVNLNIQHVVAGFDYTYGAKGLGAIDDIASDSAGRVAVTKVAKYALHGEKVSSTRIRAKLKNGNVQEITALLGRPYEVKYNLQKGVAPYYTLPEVGYYFATIVSGKRSISQSIYVSNQSEILFEQELFSDEFTIVFHERIAQKILESS